MALFQQYIVNFTLETFSARFYLLKINTGLVLKQTAGSCAGRKLRGLGSAGIYWELWGHPCLWMGLADVVYKFGCKIRVGRVSKKAGGGSHWEIQMSPNASWAGL